MHVFDNPSLVPEQISSLSSLTHNNSFHETCLSFDHPENNPIMQTNTHGCRLGQNLEAKSLHCYKGTFQNQRGSSI